MIIGHVLVSDDIIERNFVCDLSKCKGACCVEGDAGAPMEEFEIGELEGSIEEIKPLLTEEGAKEIEKTGVFDYDSNGGYVTPLVNGGECAFTIFDKNGIASCGIEKAYDEGRINFRKPVSCHLYPVRISKNIHHEAMNYHRWSICNPACALGEELRVPVYKFVKEALIRNYGQEWYDELDKKAEEAYRKLAK